MSAEDVCQIYRCFCELPRLRIINLLLQKPLCVCHLQEVLAEPQAKISKHLSYLRNHDIVSRERCGGWSVYSLSKRPHPILEQNLQCLQDLQGEDPIFKADLKRLSDLDPTLPCVGGTSQASLI